MLQKLEYKYPHLSRRKGLCPLASNNFVMDVPRLCNVHWCKTKSEKVRKKNNIDQGGFKVT